MTTDKPGNGRRSPLRPFGEVAPKLLQEPLVRQAFEREMQQRTTHANADVEADRVAHAERRRDEILATGRWFTSVELAAHRRGEVGSTPDEHALELRRQGRLFGVRFRGSFLHPEFQLDSSSQPSHYLPRLLAELKPTLEEDATGWTTAFWLFQPSRALDSEAPASVFPRDPERVISHARRTFSADCGW